MHFNNDINLKLQRETETQKNTTMNREQTITQTHECVNLKALLEHTRKLTREQHAPTITGAQLHVNYIKYCTYK